MTRDSSVCVGKIMELRFTGWAMVATGWAIVHPVNMLAEALAMTVPSLHQCPCIVLFISWSWS